MLRQIFIIFLLFIAGTTHAALDLELTHGLRRAIPIAVAPFSGQVKANAEDNIAQIVKADLTHSGRFHVTPFSELPNDKNQFAHFESSVWRPLVVNYVVLGRVTEAQDGRYRVQFKCFDVFAQRDSAVVLDKSFIIKRTMFRRVAHRISDAIYQQLTGKTGVFSNHIAYVLVKQGRFGPQQFSLMMADADGYNPRPLLVSSMPIMSPAFSPDGQRIAYVSFEGRRASIYVQNIQTGQRARIASYPGVNGAPAWSPDGKSLALVLDKNDALKIYDLDLKTRHLTPLTFGDALDTEPSFSPSGNALLFTSNRSGGPQVYRLALKNGRPAGQPERVSFVGQYNARPSFTQDGKHIVMLHRNEEGFNIARLDVKTGEVSLLSHMGRCQSPSVAPNGDMVLYACRMNGAQGDRQILGMASIDGEVRLRLPAKAGDVRAPVWSPK